MPNRRYDGLYENICAKLWRRFEHKNMLYNKVVDFQFLSKFDIGQLFNKVVDF